MCFHPKIVLIAVAILLLARLLSPAIADGDPPPAVVAELIKQVPATDWQTDDKRLKPLIRESAKPKRVADKSLPADIEALLAWSKPVNGLAARIDYI